MELIKHWKDKDIELTNEIVYILVRTLKNRVDRDIILGVYGSEDSAMIAKEVHEERAKKYGFDDDVFVIDSWKVWT